MDCDKFYESGMELASTGGCRLWSVTAGRWMMFKPSKSGRKK
ncbi:hypothetical protein NC651_007344 [Populus alba x Populus x berolinensis]|nr:hypothetical protein NC651_007344 [Populus alba x Populus x berolinensis]